MRSYARPPTRPGSDTETMWRCRGRAVTHVEPLSRNSPHAHCDCSGRVIEQKFSASPTRMGSINHLRPPKNQRSRSPRCPIHAETADVATSDDPNPPNRFVLTTSEAYMHGYGVHAAPPSAGLPSPPRGGTFLPSNSKLLIKDPMPAPVHRIAVLDDHEIVSAGLASLLSKVDGAELSITARTVDELRPHIAEIDLVLLDLRLADGSRPGDNVRWVRDNGARVLVFSRGRRSRSDPVSGTSRRPGDGHEVGAERCHRRGDPARHRGQHGAHPPSGRPRSMATCSSPTRVSPCARSRCSPTTRPARRPSASR